MRRAGTLSFLLSLFAFVAAACGGDADSPGDAATTTRGPTSDEAPPEPPSEPDYLLAMGDIMDEVAVAVAEVFATTARDDTSDPFTEMTAAGLTDTLDRAQSEASELEVPATFAEDHERWRVALDAAGDAAGRIASAAEAEDLVEMLLGVSDLRISGGLMTQQVSPEFCHVVRADIELLPESLCRPVEDIGETRWAAVTATNGRRYFTEVVPRLSAFDQSFTDEQTFEYLSAVQPDIERIVGELANAQASVEPPADRVGDHEALVRFYEDFADVAGRITAAAQRRDGEAVKSLFAESADVTETVRTTLSGPALEIIAPLFRSA